MELSFSQLRAKEVINMQDGRKLGRACDVVLCYPENRWLGIVVPGGRGVWKKNDLFIDLRHIIKIGEDVVLVNVGMPKKSNGSKCGHGCASSPCGAGYSAASGGEQSFQNNRNYEEFE
ncbi:MAG: YlmC/YmxH family sporulation protein [Clostridiales bacterium]|jgi:YlmC/YmxH family sporulation protein|nr:YlmC/YmxH family sporulation protein [Clostridiales bacterium]